MEIKGANVLVTGGSSGIGKETAIQFISRGANVVITGRDENKLKEVAKDIGAIPLCFDIAEISSIPAMTKKCLELLNGKLDTLINNAGVGVFPTLGNIDIKDLLAVYTTNVFGLAILTQEVVKTFKEQNYGNIINIGSTAALKGFERGSIYSSSKFALRGMTQCWQAELRKYNIRVSLVNPSEVASAFANENREERKEEANKLGPKEIADTIVNIVEMRNKGFVPEVTVWATNPF